MATNRPTFHHMNNSQSQRIFWLLEELNIDYELVLHKRQTSGPNKDRAPDELKNTHPLGKAPQLITADGRVVIESAVIVDYLITTYDTDKKFQGDPSMGNDKIRNDILSEVASASLGLTMIVETIFEIVARQTPFFMRFITSALYSQIHKNFTGPEFEAFFGYLEKELGQQDYFMGNSPGKADFMLSWPFDWCTARKYVDLKKYPALDRWHARCKARDAWKRSISKGNGYVLTGP